MITIERVIELGKRRIPFGKPETLEISGYGNTPVVTVVLDESGTVPLTNNEDLSELLAEFGRMHYELGLNEEDGVEEKQPALAHLTWLTDKILSFSQVKPSIWKKYSDEKPMGYCTILFVDNKNIRKANLSGNYEADMKFCEVSKVELWCYEVDLIKSIKEGK